ncbi:hypothetical protein FRC02_010017 [Tulasnella sp. 418]|nr:hypothetical protein FRC02_010017 [Tulasnella sp. 418]
MENEYTAFIHGASGDLQQPQPQQAPRRGESQDNDDNMHDDIEVHDNDDNEHDGDDGDDNAVMGGDESFDQGNHGQNQHQQQAGNGQAHPHTFSQSPFPVSLTYPMPYIQGPYFFIQPPHHNPYSPTGGAGHLHPPTISQAPYIQEPYDPAEFLQEDTTNSQPPTKRPRKTNIDPEAAEANRPVEELFEELDDEQLQQQAVNGKNGAGSSKLNGYRFKCLLCESRFPRKNAVVAHIKTHLGKRKFTCGSPGCGMAFVREHDCKRHEATHTGTRPFICVCGRPFARPDALRRHRERGHCGTIVEGSSAPPPPAKWKGSGRPSNLARAAAAAAASQQAQSSPVATTSAPPEAQNSDQSHDQSLHVGAPLFDEEQTAAILNLGRQFQNTQGTGNPNGMDLDLALNGAQVPGGLSDPSTGFPALFGLPPPVPGPLTSATDTSNVSFVRGAHDGGGVMDTQGSDDQAAATSKSGKGAKKGTRTSKRNKKDAPPAIEPATGFASPSVAAQPTAHNLPTQQHPPHAIPPSQFHPFMDLPSTTHQSGLLQPPLSGTMDSNMSLVAMAVDAATRLQVQQAQARAQAQAQAQQRASPRQPVMGLDSLGAGISMLGVDGPGSHPGSGRQLTDVLPSPSG